jgi:hypothetical protein
MSKRETNIKYQMLYPSSMPMQNKIWVLSVGDTLLNEQNNKTYKITEVIRSPIPGEKPQVVLEHDDSSIQ